MRYPASPEPPVSLELCHESLIRDGLIGVADKPVGVDGSVRSIVVALAEFDCAELLPSASYAATLYVYVAPYVRDESEYDVVVRVAIREPPR
jgi:hypothetical protein